MVGLTEILHGVSYDAGLKYECAVVDARARFRNPSKLYESVGQSRFHPKNVARGTVIRAVAMYSLARGEERIMYRG